jgi:hypothetical protein
LFDQCAKKQDARVILAATKNSDITMFVNVSSALAVDAARHLLRSTETSHRQIMHLHVRRYATTRYGRKKRGIKDGNAVLMLFS